MNAAAKLDIYARKKGCVDGATVAKNMAGASEWWHRGKNMDGASWAVCEVAKIGMVPQLAKEYKRAPQYDSSRESVHGQIRTPS